MKVPRIVALTQVRRKPTSGCAERVCRQRKTATPAARAGSTTYSPERIREISSMSAVLCGGDVDHLTWPGARRKRTFAPPETQQAAGRGSGRLSGPTGTASPGKGASGIVFDVTLLLILREPVVELAKADPQLGGGGVAVAAVSVEGGEDVLPLHFLQRQ